MKRLLSSYNESELPETNRFENMLLKSIFPSLDVAKGWISAIDLDRKSYICSYNIMGLPINTPKRESLWGYGEIYNPPIQTQIAMSPYHGQPLGLSFFYEQNEYQFLSYNDILFKDSQYVLGDWGFSNVNGYFMGLLTGGPAIMMANPMSSIEVYDINSTVKIYSQNYYHKTGISTEEVVINEEKLDNTKQLGNKKETYQDTLEKHTGCVGDISTEIIPNTYYERLFETGQKITTTKTDIILSTGVQAKIGDILEEYNPTNDSIPSKPTAFDWGNGSKISNETRYQKHINERLTEQFETTEQYSPKSWIHEREDGSIILMSKSGSAIELSADGDIIISPSRDLKIQTGRNMTTICGGNLNSVSQKDSMIRVTDGSLQLVAPKIYEETEKKQERINDFTGIYDIITRDTKIDKHRVTQEQYIETNKSVHTTKNSKIIGTNWVNQCNQCYFDGNYLNIKEDQSIYMGSKWLQWGGANYIISGSGKGIITAGEPVQIKHEHRQGNGEGADSFTYVSCGPRTGECKVTSIVKNVPQYGVNLQQTPNIEKESIIITTESRNYPSSGESFSTMPWSDLATNKFNNIDNDFPVNSPLLDKDGNPISWTTYFVN